MKFSIPEPASRRPRLLPFAFIFLGLFGLINLGVRAAFNGGAASSPPAKATPPAETNLASLEKQIKTAIDRADEVLAYQIFEVSIDSIEVSADGRWALARLSLLDPATRQVIPTEPGLALAERVDGEWQVYLQSDPGWALGLEQLPDDLLSLEARESWRLQLADYLEEPDDGPYTGYLLPWAGGLEKYLTRSISHGIEGSMHYAFDFAQPGYPSAMFAIHASKGGYVKYAIWTYPNGYDDGNCSHTNYLVLEHPETSPPTYTLYMHLAQDSIPEPFRTPGAAVLQGQFIGMADDTGCSSGNHLHLQTHTNPYSYWGSSVDILFGDVAINGGRPRTVNEALAYPQYGAEGQDLYLSGNTVPTDTSLPVGTITSPAMGATLTNGTVTIAGTASDAGSGLNHYQLVAGYAGEWHDIGPARTGPQFSQAWDLCSAGVPDGVVSVALNLWDNEGNLASLSGLTHLIKNFTCTQPPPACPPGPDQVALYAEPGFQGDCTLLGAGAYPDALSLGAVGTDRAASLQVGANTLATLYAETGFVGRSETFSANDRDLAGNTVGSGMLSSLRVQALTAAPLIPTLAWPAQAESFDSTASLDFTWLDGGGGQEYQVEISGPGGSLSPWLADPSWSPGSLPVGAYTWRVQARNASGVSGWSAIRNFEVTANAPGTPATVTAPYSDGFENGSAGWESQGQWHAVADAAQAHAGTYSWWYGQDGTGTYATGSQNAGDLTSPPIQIPAAGYAARFWYRYETETGESHWDQRWVQVSVEGAPFQNLVQLTDDEPLTWLESPAIDLTAFSGQTIRLRLHFTTLDGEANEYGGWWIDDFSVTESAPPVCSDPQEPNDSPETAANLGYAQIISGQICPAGDRDFYQVAGLQGDRVVIDIDAQSTGSPLDPYLFLLAADGSTVLASSDDEVLGVLRDPHLGFVFPETGTFYLKVRAWDHPGAGGADHSYTIRMDLDSIDPALDLDLAGDSYLPESPLTLTAEATDTGSGIDRVEFWWHGSNWLGEDWEFLGVDREGSDGWSMDFDPAVRPEGAGMALYVQAYDWAGNASGRGAWSLGIDRTAPQTALETLPPTLQSTAIELSWQGTDNVSGVASFDLQANRDLEGWQDFQTGLVPGQNSAWFIGEPDRLYGFRVRGTDLAGNTEAYPPDGDTVTFIQSCSAPDTFEPDDQPAQAHLLAVGGPAQQHNLCVVGDADWVRFAAVSGEHYRIFVRPTHPTSAAKVEIYSSEGTNLLASGSPAGFGEWTYLGWDAPTDGEFLIRLSHLNPAVAGDAVGIEIYLLDGYAKYMPQIRN